MEGKKPEHSFAKSWRGTRTGVLFANGSKLDMSV